MDVWVLIITHKHGEDVGVYSSREKAWDALYDYCCQWWGDWDLPWNGTETEGEYACHSMDRDKAIDLYFKAAADREGWEILQRKVDA